ncbi:MAG: EboA family metabolite traffic protein [Symploca sp. SIO2E9]|nr:EboA family metabolite traffic protein [Symploca sp. SIO2E9]
MTQITDLLYYWLSRHLTCEGLTWLDEKCSLIAGGVTTRALFAAFSAVPRYTGKKHLELTSEDLQAAEVVTGWSPGHWSADQAARTLLILALPQDDAEQYLQAIEQLFTTADVGELVALYQSLPLLPYREQHLARAAEGIRSNMSVLFNAVALRNPYPADYFDEPAWNQMVLKAVFIGSPLHLIWGLDYRANSELARMLIDYAHERWAAKRTLTPELWRLVGPFAAPSMIADLEKVLNEPDTAQQEAAALACSQSPSPEVQALLECRPDLQALIQEGTLTWNSFSRLIK